MGDGFPSNLEPIQSVGGKATKTTTVFLSLKQDTQKYPGKITGNFEFVELWNLDLICFSTKKCGAIFWTVTISSLRV